MKCTKCGKPIKRGAQFCTNCGAPVTKAAAPAAEPEAASPVAAPPTAAPAAVRQKKPHSRKKVVLLIVCIVLALAVIGAGVFFVLRLLNPVSRVMSALESGDYTKALSIYEDKVEGDREKDSTLSEDVVAYLEKCQDDFLNERMSYEQFTGVINGIRSLALNKLSSKLDDAAEYADMLNQSRIAYQTAEDFYGKQDYGSAIGYYNQVNYQDTYYDDAQSKCAECITNYRQQVLDSADEQVANGDYTGALASLKSGLDILTDDPDLTAKYSSIETEQRNQAVQTALTHAKELYDGGDLKNAIKYLNTQLDAYDDAALRQLYDSYMDELIAAVKVEADQAFQNGEYIDAVAVVNSYSDLIASSSAYDELIEYYYGFMPVPLSQLDPFSGSWEDEKSTASDCLGNRYTDALIGRGHWTSNGRGGTTVEYYIAQEYTSLSGMLAFYNDGGNSDYPLHLEIYGDDRLIYTSPTITRKTESVDFNVSVVGVKYLKLCVVIENDGTWNYDDLIIGSARLNKY